MKRNLLLLGGFLGAGKTTLIAEIGQLLQAKGEKVVVITNDQGDDLVDTNLVSSKGIPTAEITGGCFCCKFEDLQTTITRSIEEYDPTWILAEAVGSCTDLVATVIRPMKRLHGDSIHVTPITIAVDPERADLLLDEHSPFPYEVGYLFAQQVKEADLVLINKADRVSAELIEQVEQKLKQTNPNALYIRTSALQGEGVQEWFDGVSNKEEAIGRNWLDDIDYDMYADAEAFLGWLNATVKVTAPQEFSLESLLNTLGDDMRQAFLEKGYEAAHAKLMSSHEAQVVKGSLTTSQRDWDWYTKEVAPVNSANVLINARVCADPDDLKALVLATVETVAEKFGITYEVSHIESFKPGRPNPTHRDVVTA